jgi:hypothetical protein
MAFAKNVFLIFLLFGLAGCGSSSVESILDSSKQFGVFKVSEDSTTNEMDGEINSSSLSNFNALLAAFPLVNKINIVNCGGSADDEINLQVSKLVHEKGMSTHLNDNGLIASGGVDFFLAGVNRSRGTNTKIGVHSWSDDNSEASDYPRGDTNHFPYIEYYQSVGFTQQAAEDFYYFTIAAAPATGMHYMSDAEVVQFSLLTD